MRQEDKNRLQLIVLLVVVVVIASAFLGIPQDWTNQIIQWLASAFFGTFFSIYAAYFVELVTGDLLKNILITIKITNGIKFSISLFAIATIILKYLLFRSF